MTDHELYAVLNWKYPHVGKSYCVKDGVLKFQIWQDRATGQPSAEPQPDLEKCEAWLPGLPPQTPTPTELKRQAIRDKAKAVKDNPGMAQPIRDLAAAVEDYFK